jgi:hypothetical protein
MAYASRDHRYGGELLSRVPNDIKYGTAVSLTASPQPTTNPSYCFAVLGMPSVMGVTGDFAEKSFHPKSPDIPIVFL